MTAALLRFMQTDPIGQAGGLNLYAYVGGDPVNFRDVFGLCYYRGVVHNWEDPPGTYNTVATLTRFCDSPFDSHAPQPDAGSFDRNDSNGSENERAREQQIEAQREMCERLSAEVEQYKNSLSNFETESWRWSSPEALNFDLTQAQLSLQSDQFVMAVTTGGSMYARWQGELPSVWRASEGQFMRGLAIWPALVGTAAALDSGWRRNQIAALQARLRQLQAQAAGAC